MTPLATRSQPSPRRGRSLPGLLLLATVFGAMGWLAALSAGPRAMYRPAPAPVSHQSPAVPTAVPAGALTTSMDETTT